MKKIIASLIIAFALATTVHAQADKDQVKSNLKQISYEEKELKKEKKKDKKTLHKLEGNAPSYMAKQSFYADFGNIPNTAWKRDDYFDVALFKKNGQFINAFYDEDAKLVGTTTQKKFSDIPQKAQNYINKKYSDYTKRGVTFFDDNELNTTDMVMFGHQFEDADNYFVELQKGNQDIILQVDMNGNVSFFKRL